MILSGELKAGERLPAERDLALRLGVSRPVLHEALVDLASKGLVTILPRRGVEVNDYRQSGSMAILTSLLGYHHGELDPAIINSLFEMRLLVETETARLASSRATAQQLAILDSLLDREDAVNCDHLDELVKLDFDFHLQIALASQNHIYPLILNSFNAVYTHFTSLYFAQCHDTPILKEMYATHKELVAAIKGHESQRAAELMADLLSKGSKFLLDHMKDNA